MKKVYLLLAIIGLILPNVLVIQESIESGNILLYADPVATFTSMFANRISSIFAIDLLFAVLVFFLWSYQYKEQIGMQKLGLLWIGTLLFGLAGGFPMFLYLKTEAEARNFVPSPHG